MKFYTRAAGKARKEYSPRRWTVLAWALALAGAAHAQGSEPGPAPEAELAAPAPAAPPQWTFTFSPYVYHWKYDPEHRPAFIFSLERRVADHRLYGVALFRNSFAQPSAFAYVGWRWDQLLGQPQLSAKLAAGVIYGYVEDHLDKVPYNWNGFSPTVVPALAYWFTPRDSLEVMVLGTAALAFGYSHDF